MRKILVLSLSLATLAIATLTPSLWSSAEEAKNSQDWVPASLFQPSDHCVAWKASKRMFLLSSSEPSGKSCQVQVKWDGKSFEARIPINSFNSGEPDRDQEVVKILRGSTQPEIIIRAASGSTLDSYFAQGFAQGKSGSIDGVLSWGGTDFPLTFQYRSPAAGVMQVSWKGKFSDLKVEQPSVVGGLVAQVRETLELYAQFQQIEVRSTLN